MGGHTPLHAKCDKSFFNDASSPNQVLGVALTSQLTRPHNILLSQAKSTPVQHTVTAKEAATWPSL